MRSKQRLLAVLFFLFLFCEPVILTITENHFLHQEKPDEENARRDEGARTLSVTVTAYSSTPDQTDSSPFIMASGKHVHDGAVAANFLPMGTKIMLPETHGKKIFVVEDKMHRRFSDRIDIWMETREEAMQFGKKKILVKIL